MSKKQLNKIMFVLPSLKMGGAERVLINILNHLQAEEKHLIVFDPAMELNTFVESSIKIHVLSSPRVSAGLIKLVKIIWQIKPDVIMSTLTHMNFALLLMKPFLPRTTRTIVRETTLPSAIFKSSKYPEGLIRFLYKNLYSKADAIILPSIKIESEMARIMGGTKYRHFILPNPVDVEMIRHKATDKPAQQFRKDQNALLFTCVGRLHRAKGFDLLLENINKVSNPREWSLAIVGEGNERKELEKLITLHKLESKVSLIGMSDNPWAAMAQADLLLLPSRWEGLPNVALESLAMGTPVLAMETAGGIHDIAIHAGHSVTIAKNMGDFIEKLSSFAKPPREDLKRSLLPQIYTINAVVPALQKIMMDL